MRYLKKITLYVVCLIVTTTMAQVEQPNNPSLQALSYFVDVNNPKYANAEGSRYLFDDFKLAKIEGYPGSYLIRFNVFDDVVELKKEANALQSLSKQKHYQIEFLDGSGTYETRSYIAKDNAIKHTFFKKIHSSPKFALFKNFRTIFEPAKPPKSGYEPETPAKFKRKESSFYVLDLQSKAEHLLELPKKKKTFATIFGTRSKAISDFIKKERLKLNSEEDLVRILRYCYQQ